MQFLRYSSAAASDAVGAPSPVTRGRCSPAWGPGRRKRQRLLRDGTVPLTSSLSTSSDRLTDLTPGQLLLTGRMHRFSKLTLSRVTAPRRKLDSHDRWQRGILVAGLRIVVLESISKLICTSRDVCDGASSHRDSPQILGSGRAHGVCDSNDTLPLDDAYLNENAGLVSTYEHRHRIVLHKVTNGEAQCVEHSLIRHTVPICTVEDDGVLLHVARLLAVHLSANQMTQHEGLYPPSRPVQPLCDAPTFQRAADDAVGAPSPVTRGRCSPAWAPGRSPCARRARPGCG